MQTSKTFFERNEIAAVLINEAVTAVDVYYYLCFVIKGSEELAIGFPVSCAARGVGHFFLTSPSRFQ